MLNVDGSQSDAGMPTTSWIQAPGVAVYPDAPVYGAGQLHLSVRLAGLPARQTLHARVVVVVRQAGGVTTMHRPVLLRRR